jgi:hypothetical protein
MIVHTNNFAIPVKNYTLDTTVTSIDVNLQNYVNGAYTVALFENGNVVDAKTLIKN